MDIICRERTCVYNKGFSCSKRKILIGDKINCTDYEKKPDLKELEDTSREVFGPTPPKYHSHRESKKGCIHCEAKCLFRNEQTCEANGITVNKLNGKPLCVTYFKE